MRCNQHFFGQEQFEPGTPERAWCERLGRLKPALHGGGFALRDCLPPLPVTGGVAQVKYNGMLAVVLWDATRGRFVAWSHRGRCYYSLDDGRRHPVTAWFDARAEALRGYAFLGETHVVSAAPGRAGAAGRAYMTPFNRSMSLIKNPRSAADVARIRLAVFDYRVRRGEAGFEPELATNVERFAALRRRWGFAAGVDAGSPVHLVDAIDVESTFDAQRGRLQGFWDEYVGQRGFEGIILHATDGGAYKVKYRDTLDAAVIALREVGGGAACAACGARFDLIGAIQLVRQGRLRAEAWFDARRRLLRSVRPGEPCPLCAAATQAGPQALLGAKIALMRADGCFVDIADGAQLSRTCPLLWQLEPLYSAAGYLWLRPERVIEVSYQDLYADRPRPLYTFDGERYGAAGQMTAVSLRPYGARERDDKAVNPDDLRLEQLRPLVDRIHRIAEVAA